jgi:hypothetical protein
MILLLCASVKPILGLIVGAVIAYRVGQRMT